MIGIVALVLCCTTSLGPARLDDRRLGVGSYTNYDIGLGEERVGYLTREQMLQLLRSRRQQGQQYSPEALAAHFKLAPETIRNILAHYKV